MEKENKLITIILFLLLTGFTIAQSSGKVTGKVTDASTGEPVVGATIIVDGTSYGSVADINGDYIIVKVPSGSYNIVATAIGYTKTTIQKVQVLVDLTTKLNIILSSTAITLGQDVIIIAQVPMVKKDLTSTESRVTSDEIRQLPLQNLDQLITLQAGVNKDAGGGIHIRGGRSSEISYLINGVSITDDYSRSQALTIETESVQELQVISGTFNAEYGNALSGVVNIVTKTGGSKFQSNVELWSGDYLSTHKDIFWNIDKVSPFANYNFLTSFGGPVIKDQLTFFATIRKYYNSGYIYGRNVYNPQGRYKLIDGQFESNPGDNSYISMNSSNRWSGQGTIDWRMFKDLRLKIDAFGSMESNRNYDHLYRLNPNGTMGGKSKGYSFFTGLTHTILQNTFQEFTFAYKYNDFNSQLYDNPYDSRYVHPDSLNISGYHFLRAGTNLNRFQRNTKSIIAKWDFTSQIDRINLTKLGLEIQTDKVFYENINLIPAVNTNGQQLVPFVPFIQGIESPQHDRFERSPFKFSAYIQDKIEFESLIINVGLRFDLFNPNGQVPADPEDPNIYNPFKQEHIYKDLNGDGKIGLDEQTDVNKLTVAEREAFWYKKASVKTQLSPRFGIAYPITDKGIIRFSYGIFQQIPEYSQLYLGDQFKLTSAQGIQGPFGNNDLKPQRTTIYELGLQQQIFENVSIDATVFYRDIRDWISSSQPIPTYLAGISYSERINRDFANVKGITLAINKRFKDYFSFGIDYTFQVAEGTNSSPDQEFYAQQNGSEPTRVLTPLNWDQTHTLNANIYVGTSDWGISLISTLSTGQPYTPTLIQGAYAGRNILTGLAQNSRRKPLIANLDLELHKNFDFSNFSMQFFVKVFNLLDMKNPLTVFGDTGKPDYTLQEKTVIEYDNSWFAYPNYYSEPRNIYVGTKISL
ncbi:MAG: carboxypeptidase-like regulatory domain-containing protein [Ignavibacteriales bacterium]|nr:carboxypeptidase-like regulatory domain-containing protein [Ignavibacteriales bacterium]